MALSFDPLHVPSLKEACIAHLEELILSGNLHAGDKLPSERDLALQMEVSRPVLHEALVDLASKGLVTIQPRRRVTVNDYRKDGSAAIITSLLAYHQGEFDPQLVESLFQMRILIEAETARLAAFHAADTDIQTLAQILDAERKTDCGDVAKITELDFELHLQVAILSGNLIYPLILNSFKKIYTHFTGQFFKRWCQTEVIGEVLKFHEKLLEAIQNHQSNLAAEIMVATLKHGEELLRQGGTL
jgi:GntR family transcriptional regulator, transcriptional repressor for pyruvate dehydrogenase complex